MPRIVQYDSRTAKRLDKAIENIVAMTPSDAGLQKRANRGTLKLNFATVHAETGVPRHLFDREECVYPEQYAAIVAKMPEKGTVEPLAQQLARARKELQTTTDRLDRSHTYAAHVLTQAHQLELELARANDEITTLTSGASTGSLVGSGRLIGLPPPERKRPPPAKRMGKRRA